MKKIIFILIMMCACLSINAQWRVDDKFTIYEDGEYALYIPMSTSDNFVLVNRDCSFKRFEVAGYILSPAVIEIKDENGDKVKNVSCAFSPLSTGNNYIQVINCSAIDGFEKSKQNAEEVVDYIRYEKGYVTFGASLMNGDTILLEVPCINN